MKKTQTLVLVMFVVIASFAVVSCSSMLANQKMRTAIEWRNQGDMDRYKASVQDAYQTDPANPYALNGMGTIAEQDGKFKEAVEFYKKAIANAGDSRVTLSNVKEDEGMLLKDVCADNLKNVQAKIK